MHQLSRRDNPHTPYIKGSKVRVPTGLHRANLQLSWHFDRTSSTRCKARQISLLMRSLGTIDIRETRDYHWRYCPLKPTIWILRSCGYRYGPSTVICCNHSRFANSPSKVTLWYEYLLTLDDEVKFFWGRKLNSVTILFLFNRYFPLLGEIAVLVYCFVPLPEKVLDSSKLLRHIWPLILPWNQQE